ncbi:MAG: Rne/Rng family ribonuclease, partial [Thermodesulfobacteriota bacterium]
EENLGYIVRTAAEGVQKEKLIYEMGFLTNLWENVQARYRDASAPSILHQELMVSLRAVRDLLTHEAQQLVVDSRTTYSAILNFLDTFMPSLKDSVVLHEEKEPIFDAHNLEGDISRALKKKVWLKSGGYIVIEHTEALVAIDVNTGRYVGKHNLEETILKTNLEAVKEIAYQIRLRDIGGIIIIDFIDMEKKVNREKVYNALKEAVKKDRSKTHILPMSDMGLIQMTRKRIRKSLTRLLCEPCFYCDGEGYLMSGQSICHNIYREVLRDNQDLSPGGRLTIRVNPEIAELLHDDQNHIILSLERAIGKQIVVYPNTEFHLEEFDIFETVRV